MKKNNTNKESNMEPSPFRKGSKDYEYGEEQEKLKGQIDEAFGEFRDIDTEKNL